MKKYRIFILVLMWSCAVEASTKKCTPEEKTPEEQIDTVTDMLPTFI